MHEHNPVHELDVVAFANSQDLLQIQCGQRSGFLSEYMLASFRSSDNPLLAQSGRKWNVDRIDVFAIQQCLVTLDAVGNLALGCVCLAFTHKSSSRFDPSTCHCNQSSSLGLCDCTPIFSGNSSGRQNAPTAQTQFRHVNFLAL